MKWRDEVETAAEEDRIVIGTDETIKNKEDVKKIVFASNAPERLTRKVRDAFSGSDTEFVESDFNNKELCSLCGESFTASVVGVEEEESAI
ncbi:MAG: ribosomal L7Ae/L30e/S12e/Gadd45 family protein [Candidatus Nanohaloarchaeota archaeon QJJ-9]|nr:ribosomal L7Ae/L30e/S12e/Gadd45 family protein [Candidatus Nanohaloarchaeota archaeon QJJ-9]